MTDQPAPRRSGCAPFGLLLMGGGLLGLVLAVAGLVAVGLGMSQVEQAIVARLDLADRALTTTDEGLAVAGVALNDADATLKTLSATIGGATQALSDTLPTLEGVGALAGDELPATIRSTQTALRSAQATARVIDQVLGAISSFGLISAATYNPQVPLSAAIGEVSASLNELPASLGTIGAGIDRSAASLGEVNGDLAQAAESIAEIGASVRAASGVVAQYRQLVGELQAEVRGLRAALPGWVSLLRIGLALVLAWMALAQLGLIAQGWDLIKGKR